MRHPILLALATIAFPASHAQAADVSVLGTHQGYRTAASFQRISEYFTGRENTGREILLRSRPADRAGYYLLVRLDNRAAPVGGARVELSVVIPGSATPRVFEFNADIPAGARTLDVGVTGGDWPAASATPVAWSLVLRTADGAELARAQSFLWAKPDAAPAAK